MRGARFELQDVRLDLGGTTALRDVNVVIEPYEAVAFVGPSGAGKTSLLRLLNGALRPSAGTVRVDGRALAELSTGEVQALRADLAFVHQDLALVPNLRVVKNVLSGRLGRFGFWRSLRTMLRPDGEELADVHAILERVGIPEKLFQRTDRLSGGQQQRVAIARAIYQEARAFLVDEPVASLDPARGRATMVLLTELARETGVTLVASVHDLDLAREFFPRLIGVREGRIRFDAATSSIEARQLDALFELTPDELLADGS